MSYNKLIYHIIFGTKDRMPTISLVHDRDLYAYIHGTIQRIGGLTYRINGMPDHVHILASIPPKISLSDAVKTIKQSSSIWLGANPHFPKWRGWANGYAALTYSENDIEHVKAYIINQKSHHASVGFAEEYEAIVRAMGYPSPSNE